MSWVGLPLLERKKEKKKKKTCCSSSQLRQDSGQYHTRSIGVNGKQRASIAAVRPLTSLPGPPLGIATWNCNLRATTSGFSLASDLGPLASLRRALFQRLPIAAVTAAQACPFFTLDYFFPNPQSH